MRGLGVILLLAGALGFRGTSPTLSRVLATAGADSLPARFGFGQTASAERIAQWNLDVRPDGLGLPAGSGTAAEGAVIFAKKCAACHGPGGTGGPNGALVVTTPAPGQRPANVIGNYWPYATTEYQSIPRASSIMSSGPCRSTNPAP